MVKISVVIPVYGVEKYIDQLLDSIRKQTLKDIEVIFVDDGSPDNCPQILDAFAKEDSRYRVIHQKNGGVSVARNTGLAHATGEYVYIADSDDWLTENALSDLWAEAERTNADLIYGDYYCETEAGSEYASPFKKSFVTDDQETIKLLQCAVNVAGRQIRKVRPEFESVDRLGGAPWRVLIRRALLEDNGICFDPYVRGLGDDILFSLHAYEHVKRVAYVQKPIYHYRILNVSYSHGFKKNLLENYALIFERMEDFLNKNRKEQIHWDFYYAKVWIYLKEAMRRYFLNTNNPKSEKERFGEFKSVLYTEPYKTALRKVPLSLFVSKKERIQILMLRLGFYRLYWKLKK